MTDFICFGVPYFIGEKINARTEVEDIRTSGIVELLGAEWIEITPHFKNATNEVIAVNRALSSAVSAASGKLPLVFAADCVSAIGTLKGLNLDDVAVVWYDAHGDFNTPATTPSGFLGGMPLAMLVGRGDQSILTEVGLLPVAEDNVLICDARDLDPLESVALQESAVTHLTHVNQLLSYPLPNKPLYIHLDVDIINTEEMPANSYPAAGGPTLAEVAETVKRIAREGDVRGVLFSLWNGALATDRRSLDSTLTLVRAFQQGITENRHF